jgi:hypothetical protein
VDKARYRASASTERAPSQHRAPSEHRAKAPKHRASASKASKHRASASKQRPTATRECTRCHRRVARPGPPGVATSQPCTVSDWRRARSASGRSPQAPRLSRENKQESQPGGPAERRADGTACSRVRGRAERASSERRSRSRGAVGRSARVESDVRGSCGRSLSERVSSRLAASTSGSARRYHRRGRHRHPRS